MEIPHDLTKFRNDGELFLRNLLAEMQILGISAQAHKADHLCFRVSTQPQYEALKDFLSGAGDLLAESLVNGRPIATYRLKEPFRAGGQIVDLLELPSPKAGSDYQMGFEHAEFVLKESFDVFASRNPELKLSNSGIKKFNSELGLKTKVGKAKFHHLSLDRVIEIEEAKITDVIFDFDGTLIDSRDAIYQINRIAFSDVLQREVTLAEAKEKFRPEFGKLFAAFGIETSAMKNKAMAAWGKASQSFTYQLFEGVSEMLDQLRGENCRLHLWTARDEKSARAIMEFHGIAKHFESASFATEFNSKPDASNLHFDWRSANKNSFVMVGDSPTDMMGAKNICAIAAAALWDPFANENALVASDAEIFLYNVPVHERRMIVEQYINVEKL